MFDSHMHTELCHHAVGEPEDYAAQAIVEGLDGIIFTCHNPMPGGFAEWVRMAPETFDDYLALIERCRKTMEGQLEVRLGMESDYFPGMEDWLEKLHARAPFHYILGSVHYFLDEWHEHLPDQMQAMTEPEVAIALVKAYFEAEADAAETGLFDCIAHPDLIKNALPLIWDPVAFEDLIAPSLDRIAATGVAMELNTSGRRKSFPEFNPAPEILTMMHERGIPVVIGSDSHEPGRVGEGFEDALDDIEAAGYEAVSVFENRKRSEIPLAEARAGLKIPSQNQE